MEISEFLATVRTMHEDARRRGLFFQEADNPGAEDRYLEIAGHRDLAFASCSYLSLEHHPALIEGIHRHVDRYGSQFSTSRGYVSLHAHAELESTLDELFGGHTLVSTSTTLIHQIALPVLVTERDAIVLDHQVHHSVHIAATLARASGAHVEIIRHGQLQNAITAIERLARTKRMVWFSCDGVFSMFGDLAPLSLLEQILDIAPNVYLYIDDAHGMSWAGRHGCGSFLSRMPLHDRLVVATSLNKAFSASGGCVILPSAELRDEIRLCAAPMVFSGPLQPPMIGAALASAAIHLSPEIYVLQQALRARVDFCNERSQALGLPLLAINESPLFFYRCGLPRIAFAVAEHLLQDGIYVTASTYPSVPMATAGIRLSLTTTHEIADIDRVLQALAVAIPAAIATEVHSKEDIERAFAGCLPQESLRGDAFKTHENSVRSLLDLTYGVAADPKETEPKVHSQKTKGELLKVQITQTIQDIDRPLWDELLGQRSCSSWKAMVAAEAAFTGNEAPEHNWSFLYVIVRDPQDQVLAATYFTVALSKDDMLMRTEVSRAIEARRRDDPYFLTSLVVSMGSGLSEGSHLYLARSGPWQAALHRILEIALDEYQRTNAAILLLRDFPDDDAELANFFNDNGFIKVPMLDSHILDITWRSNEEFIARLSRRRRRQIREVQAMTPSYRYQRQTEQLSAADVAQLQQLYTNVAARKLRINTFLLPPSAIAEMLRSPTWEVITLHLDPAAGGPIDGTPVAWYGAHTSGGHYMPLVCGLNYEYVHSHGAYRQLLYQIVLRAQELSMSSIHLGMDANYEKERFRTRRIKTCAFLHSRDDFVGARMREIVAEVGLTR